MKDEKKSDVLPKEKLISNEIGRLEKLFSNIEPKTKNAVKALIENAAFMTVTLNILQEQINREGVISRYQNGDNQWGTKKSPEADIYNTMVKNLMSIMKQLTELVPAPDVKAVKEKPDEFLKIVGRVKSG